MVSTSQLTRSARLSWRTLRKGGQGVVLKILYRRDLKQRSGIALEPFEANKNAWLKGESERSRSRSMQGIMKDNFADLFLHGEFEGNNGCVEK